VDGGHADDGGGERLGGGPGEVMALSSTGAAQRERRRSQEGGDGQGEVRVEHYGEPQVLEVCSRCFSIARCIGVLGRSNFSA
jgi:hypothetical protein